MPMRMFNASFQESLTRSEAGQLYPIVSSLLHAHTEPRGGHSGAMSHSCWKPRTETTGRFARGLNTTRFDKFG